MNDVAESALGGCTRNVQTGNCIHLLSAAAVSDTKRNLYLACHYHQEKKAITWALGVSFHSSTRTSEEHCWKWVWKVSNMEEGSVLGALAAIAIPRAVLALNQKVRYLLCSFNWGASFPYSKQCLIPWTHDARANGSTRTKRMLTYVLLSSHSRCTCNSCQKIMKRSTGRELQKDEGRDCTRVSW